MLPKGLKRIIIRKDKFCGHWNIYVTQIEGALLSFDKIAHLETWGDVLIFVNVPEAVIQ